MAKKERHTEKNVMEQMYKLMGDKFESVSQKSEMDLYVCFMGRIIGAEAKAKFGTCHKDYLNESEINAILQHALDSIQDKSDVTLIFDKKHILSIEHSWWRWFINKYIPKKINFAPSSVSEHRNILSDAIECLHYAFGNAIKRYDFPRYGSKEEKIKSFISILNHSNNENELDYIDVIKYITDGYKYAGLYTPYCSKIEGSLLINEIGNTICILTLVLLCHNCKIYIRDNSIVINEIKKLLSDSFSKKNLEIYYIDKEKNSFESLETHFDYIIQNPPYDKNTHLDFIRKSMSIANITINVSPIRWLQDPFFDKKRTSTLKQYDDVARHIQDIEILDFESKNIFDMSSFSDLAIYTISNKETNFDYKSYWKTFRNDIEISILDKVCFSNKTQKISNVKEKEKINGIRVPITVIGGNRGSLPIYKDIVYTIDGKVGDKDWTECKNMGGYTKQKGSPLPISIEFNTEEEAKNFWDSYNLKFFVVICDMTIQQQHIQDIVLPFLNDYSHKITNEELYKLFDLSEKEIEFIESYSTFYDKRKKK